MCILRSTRHFFFEVLDDDRLSQSGKDEIHTPFKNNLCMIIEHLTLEVNIYWAKFSEILQYGIWRKSIFHEQMDSYS